MHALLQRHGLPTSGPLFKSASGELSNLRWDLPLEQYKFYWAKENRKDGEGWCQTRWSSSLRSSNLG